MPWRCDAIAQTFSKDKDGNNATEAIIVPSFQRGPNVWNIKQKSNLILSLIRNIPIPSIYLFILPPQPNKIWYEIIDGLQRITAITEFINNNFELDLKGTDYNEMDNNILIEKGIKIGAKNIQVTTIEQQSSSDTDDKDGGKYEIFSILNQTSVKLTGQEIRNAAYESDFVKFIKELNQNKVWRSVYGNEYDPSKNRETDAEVIIRSIIMCFTDMDFDSLSNGIRKIMSYYKHLPDTKKEFDIIRECFISACDNMNKNKIKKLHKNKSKADSYLACFMFIAFKQKEITDDFAAQEVLLLKDPDFSSSIKAATGSKNPVKTRIDKVKEYFIKK